MFDTDEDFDVDDEFLDDVLDKSVLRNEGNDCPEIVKERKPQHDNKIQELLRQINNNDHSKHRSEEPATHVENKFQERFLNPLVYKETKSPHSSQKTSSANAQDFNSQIKFPVSNVLFEKNIANNSASGRKCVPSERKFPGPAGCSSTADTLRNSSVNTENVSFQRKFPGPAGLLPFHTGAVTEKVNSEGDDGNDSDSTDQVPSCSQSMNVVLESAAWKAMSSDYDVKNSVLRGCTIAWVKGKALAQQLPNNKAPFLGVAIKSIDLTLENPYVVLQDETGSMPAVFHSDIREAVCAYLKPGSVVVLWNTGIISTGKIIRRHSLNVTMKNLISVYSNSEQLSSTETTETIKYSVKRIQNITTSQLVDNVLHSRKRKITDSPVLSFSGIFVNEGSATSSSSDPGQSSSAQSSQSSFHQTYFESDTCDSEEYEALTNIFTESDSPYFANYKLQIPNQNTSHSVKDTIPASAFKGATGSPYSQNKTFTKPVDYYSIQSTVNKSPVPVCRVSTSVNSTHTLTSPSFNVKAGNNVEPFKVSTCQNLQSKDNNFKHSATHNVSEKAVKKLSAFQLKKPIFSNSTSSTFPAVTPSATLPTNTESKTTNFNSVDVATDENNIAKSLLDSISTDLWFDDF